MHFRPERAWKWIITRIIAASRIFASTLIQFATAPRSSIPFDEPDLPVAAPQTGGPHLRETRIAVPSPKFALGQKAVSQGTQSVVVRGALFDGSGDIHVLSSR